MLTDTRTISILISAQPIPTNSTCRTMQLEPLAYIRTTSTSRLFTGTSGDISSKTMSVSSSSSSTHEIPDPATRTQTTRTRTIATDAFVDKATHTHIPDKKTKHKSSKRKVIFSRSRVVSPPILRTIAEPVPLPPLPRKIRATTLLKERTTQTPHTKTTTYIHT